MDVGCWLLKRSSANLLKNCINPFWGLVYSNGTSLNWMPIFSSKDSLRSIPLQHENLGLIHDIGCSPCYSHSQYVATISSHDAGLKVTVLKADVKDLNLSFSAVNCALIQGEPLPQGQGIAWHPQHNIICTLCENGAFVFNNSTNDGYLEKLRSFSGRDRFTTCCWNYSGHLLILATKSKLLFYRFTTNAADSCEPLVSFVLGRVCSIETIEESRLLCSVELPLIDVIRNQGEHSTREMSVTSPLEHLMNVAPANTSIVASSQLLLLGHSTNDSRPYIISRIDIQEILTPNILVYERILGLCIIGSNSSAKLQFFTVRDFSLSKAGEIVLEKGKLPKGIAVSTCNKSKLLWLLSGQSCKDCCSFLSVPDKDYVSCNMTFRIIALETLLEEKKVTDHKVGSNALIDKSQNVTNITLNTSSSDTFLKESDVSIKSKSSIGEVTKAVFNPDQEGDDKSILSFYSIESSSALPKLSEVVPSSSNDDFYSIVQTSPESRDSSMQRNVNRRIYAIEKSLSDMSKKHLSEMQEIKHELSEIKQLILSVTGQSSSKTNELCLSDEPKILTELQELHKGLDSVESKVDTISHTINSKMERQERKLAAVKSDLDCLLLK